MGKFSLWPLIAWLVATLVALAAVRAGWRWKRVPIAPTCRRCGYDISQRPSGVDVCSECGSDLTRHRAIVVLRRRPHWWITTFACLATITLIATFVTRSANINWLATYIRYAPLAVIEHHARADFRVSGDAFRNEWRRRNQDTGAYVDHLLDIQADLTVPWRDALCDEFTRLLKANTFDAAQESRYQANALRSPVTVTTDNPLRTDESLVLHLRSQLRGGDYAPILWTITVGIDGPPTTQPLVLGPRQQLGFGYLGMMSGETTREIPALAWCRPPVEPGQHTMHFTIQRRWADPSSATWKDLGKPGVTYNTTDVIQQDVLPSRNYKRTPVINAALGAEVAFRTSAQAKWLRGNFAFANVRLAPAQVDRAFLIYANIDGNLREIGSIVAAAGQAASASEIYVPLSVTEKKNLKKLTFVLRGSDKPLKAITDAKQSFWDGTVIINDVPLDGDFVTGKPLEAGATTK